MGQGASAALWHAAATGNLEQLETVLDQGTDVNAQEEVGVIPVKGKNSQEPSAAKLHPLLEWKCLIGPAGEPVECFAPCSMGWPREGDKVRQCCPPCRAVL